MFWTRQTAFRPKICALDNTGSTAIVSIVTNVGQADTPPVLAGQTMKKGTYEMRFFVAEYFQHMDTKTVAIPFLDIVPVRFSIAEDN